MVFTLDMYFLSTYADVTLVENSHELIRVRLFLVSYRIVHANTMPVSRDLSIIGLFLFTIPRIFNTKNDAIQYQKTIPPKNIFFNIIAFLAI